MARRTINLDLDEELIRRARDADAQADKTDAEVVEDALAFYLGMRALDEAHAQGGLDEESANRVAVEEVRAVRARRGRAA